MRYSVRIGEVYLTSEDPIEDGDRWAAMDLLRSGCWCKIDDDNIIRVSTPQQPSISPPRPAGPETEQG